MTWKIWEREETKSPITHDIKTTFTSEITYKVQFYYVLFKGFPAGSVVKKSEVAQSCPTLCDPWTVAHQAPPSMGFSRQENWSGLPFPPPGDLPDPGIEPRSPALQADAFNLCTLEKPLTIGEES